MKIVKEVKRSDGLWRFACGDVFCFQHSYQMKNTVYSVHYSVQCTSIYSPVKYIAQLSNNQWIEAKFILLLMTLTLFQERRSCLFSGTNLFHNKPITCKSLKFLVLSHFWKKLQLNKIFGHNSQFCLWPWMTGYVTISWSMM